MSDHYDALLEREKLTTQLAAERAAHLQTRLRLEQAVELLIRISQEAAIVVSDLWGDCDLLDTPSCVVQLNSQVDTVRAFVTSDPPVILPILRQAEAALGTLITWCSAVAGYDYAAVGTKPILRGSDIESARLACEALHKITGGVE